MEFNLRRSFVKSISPKSHFVKNRCFVGPERSTGPNATLLDPKKGGRGRGGKLASQGLVEETMEEDGQAESEGRENRAANKGKMGQPNRVLYGAY